MKKVKMIICVVCILFLCSCSLVGGKLYKEGMSKMELKDYKAAEVCFREAIKSGYKKNKAEIIYTIIHNYNSAENMIKSEKFNEAQDFIEDIPNTYTEYIISSDIDELTKKINDYNEATKIFKKAREYYDKELYTEASAVLATLNSESLPEKDYESVTDLDAKIKKKGKIKEKSNDMNYRQRINELVENYVYGLSQAVNSGDYNYLRPYILDGSSLCTTQKALVKNLYNNGTEEYVERYSVSKIEWKSESTCIISTEEVFSVYNGDDWKVVTGNYNYDVIEDENGHLLLTTISR